MTTLHDFGGGWDGHWTRSFGLSQFHGHGTWLVCKVESYIRCPCPWVLSGHGCDIIGNIIGNVTIFEYMGTI